MWCRGVSTLVILPFFLDVLHVYQFGLHLYHVAVLELTSIRVYVHLTSGYWVQWRPAEKSKALSTW